MVEARGLEAINALITTLDELNQLLGT